jgi:tetratricopeptide (TPR) repeat protein
MEYCTTELDRLTIFERQATAYYQASDWTHVAVATGLAREIKAKLFPELNPHDDLELIQRRARWKTTHADGLLLDSLKCVNAQEASVIHRLEAGVLALILLTNSGDGIKAREIFNVMTLLSADISGAAEQILEAKMIFHTTWGSLDEGVEAALALVELERTRHDVGALARALTNASVTLRVAGRFDQASEHLHQSLTLADRHRILLSKTQPLRLLAYMAIEQGRIDDARSWIEALTLAKNEDDDRLVKLDIATINARIALAEGQYDEAVALVEADLISMRSAPVSNRREYWYALRVATELATTGRASADTLANLEHEYSQMRTTMFQAFPSYALYAGLVSIGETRKAKTLLDEYLTKDRREPWPAPQHILDSLMPLVGQQKKRAAECGPLLAKIVRSS